MNPWFVKKLKEWNTCCCKYHTKISELKEGFYGIKIRGKMVHGQCTCSCVEICCPFGEDSGVRECQTHVCCFKKLTKLWSSILCPTIFFSSFHKKDYLLGNYPICGVKTLKISHLNWIKKDLWLGAKFPMLLGKV